MSEFIKVGEKIVNKPTGLDYDLINGKVYNLKWDRYNGMSYFEEDGLLSLPAKVYTTKSDDVFIKRVNTYFQKTSKLSTGVMLSGIKGTGKTVMAKVIAKNSNLPIIVVDEDYPTGRINDFFRKFETPVTIIFDNEDRVNDYLKDRCSRVRYIRHFEANDNARFLREILRDKGIAEDKIEDTYTFIVNNFGLLSIDNILSFIDEKLLFPELSNEEIFNDMNISSKKGKKNIIGETPDEEDEDDDWLYDDDEEYEEDESLHKIIMCSCN